MADEGYAGAYRPREEFYPWKTSSPLLRSRFLPRRRPESSSWNRRVSGLFWPTTTLCGRTGSSPMPWAEPNFKWPPRTPKRRRMILEHYQASKKNLARELCEESVTFACQECGKSVTFPTESCGHVESCPSCGAFVDVPNATESPPPTGSKAGRPQPVALEAEPPKAPASDSRTTSQLWIEVFAVLCLAYFPYLLYALHALAVLGPGPANPRTVYSELSRIVDVSRFQCLCWLFWHWPEIVGPCLESSAPCGLRMLSLVA